MKRFVRLMMVLLVACVVSSCSITRELEQNASPIAFTEVNNYFVKNNSVPQKLLRKVISTGKPCDRHRHADVSAECAPKRQRHHFQLQSGQGQQNVVLDLPICGCGARPSCHQFLLRNLLERTIIPRIEKI